MPRYWMHKYFQLECGLPSSAVIFGYPFLLRLPRRHFVRYRMLVVKAGTILISLYLPRVLQLVWTWVPEKHSASLCRVWLTLCMRLPRLPTNHHNVLLEVGQIRIMQIEPSTSPLSQNIYQYCPHKSIAIQYLTYFLPLRWYPGYLSALRMSLLCDPGDVGLFAVKVVGGIWRCHKRTSCLGLCRP